MFLAVVRSMLNVQQSIARLGQEIVKKGYYLNPEINSNNYNGRSTILQLIQVKNSKTRNVIGKINNEKSRFDKEIMNYQQIGAASRPSCFVQHEDVVALNGKQMIIMEKGFSDLGKFSATNGPIRGGELKSIAKQMVNIVDSFHAKNYVWGDMKLENIVLTTNNNERKGTYSCKAIDLESAVKVNTPLTDFSPEILGTQRAYITHLLIRLLTRLLIDVQFLEKLINKKSSYLNVDLESEILGNKAMDIWALGINLLSLYYGKPVLSKDLKISMRVVQSYEENLFDLGISGVDDILLKRLLQSMLKSNAADRATIGGVRSSLYLNTM